MERFEPRLAVLEKDEWLLESAAGIIGRYHRFIDEMKQIGRAAGSIVDYANGYKYFGFQRDNRMRGWWFREWLPGAHAVWLTGDFNDWARPGVPLEKSPDGTWSAFFPDLIYAGRLTHRCLVKMIVKGNNGTLERIPSYIRRVVQDDATKNFTGQIWEPSEKFDWSGDDYHIRPGFVPLIYEAHIGMAQEREGVGTYLEFAKKILPRIKKLGYTAVQLMGIAEHPYYGSFGYHVSSFFAPSSRFGTPEHLKELVRTAHGLGLAVIMDIVHSHYVKNINEGLDQLDGTKGIYSPEGKDGDHPYWGSKIFDYSKPQVRHFLLSNVKYWLDEYHFDGFRFDGVTSMIYKHHGYVDFGPRELYFDEGVNEDAILYLTLANKLVHDFRRDAITIAEDVSGMPAMCSPVEEGGVGFDYRLGMAIADFWIKMLKEVPDERWDIWDIWKIMTDRLPYVKTIAYAESHDQAMVGDKTLAFRLMDKEMYTDMNRSYQNYIVERGMALHKMIRLATVSMGGQGYMNFMGNEFGHPDWIDFPREGNGWKYDHARRQWSLASNSFLRYSFLNRFDSAMIRTVKRFGVFGEDYPYNLCMDHESKTMVYSRGCLVFVLNWHTEKSTTDYCIPVPNPGRYKVVLSTDSYRYGGQQRIAEDKYHFSFPESLPDGSLRHFIRIYNVCRTGVVYRKLAR